MEVGIMIASLGLVATVALLVYALKAGVETDAARIPGYEPEYESLAINVADYRFAV
jgi:hypothetical protein